MRLIPLLALTGAISLTGCAATLDASSSLTRLIDAIDHRLDIAEAVALHKWDTRQPVHAPQREQDVLANVRQAALTYDLNAERAETFFADQIEANKLLQYHYLNTWHQQRQAPDTQRRDLASEIRPQLDNLQDQLLQDLARFDQQRMPLCAEQLADALAQRSKDTPRHLALVRATAQLCERS
ncbi:MULTISPECIES: chorismate mutase [Pseudomonas]|uniref:chorismate mutase n=1 Tax=Pseudomonas TaxID=286 RepID=UPI0018A95716|nr:chorismate mutase [Pseudomonas guariconensis]MBF8721086.1 chorismate mutase [Pseudomonas guariconensis]